MMNQHHPELLSEIEAFLCETGMGASYLGKAAVQNSEVVARLRTNRRVWPETEAGLRQFMRDYRLRKSLASDAGDRAQAS
jgi:hypothetical protein